MKIFSNLWKYGCSVFRNHHTTSLKQLLLIFVRNRLKTLLHYFWWLNILLFTFHSSFYLIQSQRVFCCHSYVAHMYFVYLYMSLPKSSTLYPNHILQLQSICPWIRKLVHLRSNLWKFHFTTCIQKQTTSLLLGTSNF